MLFRAAGVPEGPDPLLVDAASVVLPPVVRHQFPDALGFVVVLPLWGGNEAWGWSNQQKQPAPHEVTSLGGI